MKKKRDIKKKKTPTGNNRVKKTKNVKGNFNF